MASNVATHPLQELNDGIISSWKDDEEDNGVYSEKASLLETSGSSVEKNAPGGSSGWPRGLDHCTTAPVGLYGDVLIDDNEIKYSRSLTEKASPVNHNSKLDRLSEREKQKLIVELVRIQNDGTVEVDINRGTPVSELLEFQPIKGGQSTITYEKSLAESFRSIPRLKIVILVVGTRGDVQPFLAIAKRLQEFGHRVRLATHANFSSFVRSAGVEFYPLGGDPRELAGYMARNKGLIPSGPGEIAKQRKQLKAIIESLLPACTEPDMQTAASFRAQAIIANPPAYGHVHVAEALGVPIHIFFTMPWTPTHEFPHPLARVPQSAAYWLSYIVVDLMVWWSIRTYINDFRKRKLDLAPIAYFSTYHGSISHLPTAYMWSPHVVPKPSDWGPLVDVVGYCFMNLGSKYQPGEEFIHWIERGSPPIYIGFGSMVQLLPQSERIKRPFKYVNAIGSLPAFLPMIQEYWSSTVPLFHSTSAMFRFSKKLKSLKPLIREMGKDKLGNLTKKAKEAFGVLCEKQSATLANPSEDAIKEESEAYGKWLHVASLKEDFLKQRSKLYWLDVGDQNNKTFHRAIKTRQAQNLIREIRCANGRVVTTHSEIKREAENFFSGFLNQSPESYKGVLEEELQDILDFRCSTEDCRLLEAEVNEEEVRKVLFAMPNNKSPGPDGFSCEFFKTTWAVISKDFTVAVQSVFRYGFLPKGVNSTILALIPKKLDSLEMKDYRPIACCNVLYKVVSKILANRLKRLLPRIIVENQSAFVQGRLLIENVLLASELVKDYHKDGITPRCVMKIDISKAFDSVQWDFVLKCLGALGFPVRFIHWIKLCITTPSLSVQVNGDLAGYFQSSRGLRQGCSLSPYLFVLSMNVLSRKFDRAVEERKFLYHPECQRLSLTHLCFADDLMVFVEGSKESIKGALSVFDVFEEWPGLRISMEKSTINMAGVQESEKRSILRNFPFAEGKLPVRYLGLPLMTQATRRQDYLPLLEKIRSTISSWTCRFLSYAGRLQLISSVLISIINFWISAFRLPSRCVKELKQICSAFLWTGPELKSTNAKVAWKVVCSMKSEGGLGLRDLKAVNMVSGLKLIWRLLSEDSLWGRWIKSNLLKRRSFWTVNSKMQSGSWMWHKMLKLREVAKRFFMKELGNGRHTSFWYDKWSEKGVLADVLGARGIVDMGVCKEATVEDAVLNTRRRRRHRTEILNEIETELSIIKENLCSEIADRSLWKGRTGYKQKFSTQETWVLLREAKPQCNWAKAVWFAQATTKFAFMVWLSMQDRMSTMDRIARWSNGIDTTCVLCRNANESRNHLFFECTYSAQIWEKITKGILQNAYTNIWSSIQGLILDDTRDKWSLFCIRYAFQAVIYAIWRERNKIKHGDKLLQMPVLIKMIDKIVRNRISLLKMKRVKGTEKLMQYWFQTRI